VFVAVLGMCPALAVTNTVINGLAMGGASLFVLTFSILFSRTEMKPKEHWKTELMDSIRVDLDN